jgi:hypothetical protein
VTGKRLLKRLVTVVLGMLGLFMFLHAVDADAMPAGNPQPSFDQLVAPSVSADN